MAKKAYEESSVDRELTAVRVKYDAVVKENNALGRQNAGLHKLVKRLESAVANRTTNLSPEDLKGVPKKHHALLEDIAKDYRSMQRYRTGAAGSNQRILQNGAQKIKQLENDPAYRKKLVRAIENEQEYQSLLIWSKYGRGAKAKETLATIYITRYVEREREILKKLKDIYKTETGKEAPKRKRTKRTAPKKKRRAGSKKKK
jgi:hypothetical protein